MLCFFFKISRYLTNVLRIETTDVYFSAYYTIIHTFLKCLLRFSQLQSFGPCKIREFIRILRHKAQSNVLVIVSIETTKLKLLKWVDLSSESEIWKARSCVGGVGVQGLLLYENLDNQSKSGLHFNELNIPF